MADKQMLDMMAADLRVDVTPNGQTFFVVASGLALQDGGLGPKEIAIGMAGAVATKLVTEILHTARAAASSADPATLASRPGDLVATPPVPCDGLGFTIDRQAQAIILQARFGQMAISFGLDDSALPDLIANLTALWTILSADGPRRPQ